MSQARRKAVRTMTSLNPRSARLNDDITSFTSVDLNGISQIHKNDNRVGDFKGFS